MLRVLCSCGVPCVVPGGVAESWRTKLPTARPRGRKLLDAADTQVLRSLQSLVNLHSEQDTHARGKKEGGGLFSKFM